MLSAPELFEKNNTWLPQAQEHVFDSVDPAQEFVAEMFVDHELEVLAPNKNFNFKAKSLFYGDVGLICLAYNTRVQISPSPLQDFVLVQIPMCGTSTLRIGRHKIESSITQATIPPQDQSSIMHWYPRSPHICVYVKQSRLDQVASEIYGIEGIKNIRLQPAMNLRTLEAQRFKLAITEFHQDMYQSTGLSRLARLSEESLIARLLAASITDVGKSLDVWPQQHQPNMLTGQKRNLAHDFRELVEKHFDEDVTITDFAERLRVSIRTLQLAVAAEFETTPSELLLKIRLGNVHRLLTDPANDDNSIAELALRCGFNHQSRFTAAYRVHFGQTPGKTRQGEASL